MLFNSPEFIFLFLPIAVFLHFAFCRRGMTAAIVCTTIASLLFYAWWNPPFLLLPVLSILLNYGLGTAMMAAEERAARVLLGVGIVANLSVLGWFKYAGFLLSVIDGRPAPPPDVPLALSFTTFVQIAFLADIYRHRHPVDITRYALFVSFFPHLIAGPIVRWSELGPQIADRTRYRLDWGNVALGLTIFTFGLAKKMLLADPLAVHVGPVFAAAAQGEAVTTFAAWAAAFAYSAQLYFDFSGYSEMAIGLGLLFNLRLPINFAAPLRATSVMDFWRRWHITLSRFLRDFVYVPLGGGRCGPARRAFNLFATMTLGGLWHGAGWTFIVWGAFQGVLLAGNHAWRTLRGPRAPTRSGLLLGWFATFAVFAIGMVLFRAPDIATAGRLFAAMAGIADAPVPAHAVVEWDAWIVSHGYLDRDVVLVWCGANWSVVGTLLTGGALAVALLLPETMELFDYREAEEHSDWRRPVRVAWASSPGWLAVTVLLFAIAFDRIGRVSEFLYYQF